MIKKGAYPLWTDCLFLLHPAGAYSGNPRLPWQRSATPKSQSSCSTRWSIPTPLQQGREVFHIYSNDDYMGFSTYGESVLSALWITQIPTTRKTKKSRQINGLVNEWYLEDISDNIRSILTNRRNLIQCYAIWSTWPVKWWRPSLTIF